MVRVEIPLRRDERESRPLDKVTHHPSRKQMEVPNTAETTKSENGTDLLVYSTVTATLSHQVISAIHGNKVEFLSSILKLENISFHFIPESQIYCLTGSLNDVIKCQGHLRTLIEGLKLGLPANNIYESLVSNSQKDYENATDKEVTLDNAEKVDKGVNCDILKAPIITKSGRVVKRSENSVNDYVSVDSLAVEGSEPYLPEVKNGERKGLDNGRKNKGKRGRPRKYLRGIDEKIANTSDTAAKVEDKIKDEQLESDNKQEHTDSDLFKTGDILNQSIALSNVFQNEVVHGQTPDEMLKPDSSDSEMKEFEVSTVGENEETDDGDDGKIEMNSLTSEIGKAVKESLQTVYLNKLKEPEEKVSKTTGPLKTNSDKNKDIAAKLEMKRLKQNYEKKMPFKYSCTKCSYKSKRESHFKIHKKIHLSNPDMLLYKCDLCDFTAIRQSVLQKHKVSHSDNYLSCSSCEYKTNNSVHLSNHIKNRHESKVEKTISNSEWFSCNVCPYRTKRYSTYTKHYLSHGLTFSASEDGKVLTFKCNLCSYKTQRKEHLVRHKSDVHGNNRPYLCDLCGMAFKRVDALAAHKFTHLDKSQRSLPFKCTTCKKAFKSRAHLKEHLAVHTSMRAYLCDMCGVSFKTKAVQRKHQQNIHLNPQSFKCDTCPKAFNTKYALLRHIRHHEYSGPFKSNSEAVKDLKTEESQIDPFGVEGQIDDQGQGQDLQVQEVQLQFHLKDYGGQVTLVPEGQGEGQSIQITSLEGHDFDSEQVQNNDLDSQLLESEQVNVETIDENLTAIQTITLPSSHLRQLTNSIHTTEGDEIYIQNFPTDEGTSFVDPSREAVRQLFISSNVDGQTSVIEVDGNTTYIQEIQGPESLIEEVRNLGGLEGIQSNRAILTTNTDGIEKVFLANVNSGDVENL